ncbi:MAG: sigma-70 family RNA polymerase sigma factor [Phycisphaerales bacterium]|nr:sigma-70 family RNA polymerase sigma factor [Phycisphaerales bacterium]
MNQLSDEQLFGRYRQGDTDALRTLILRYEGDLFRFLFRLLGDKAAAEDVFQETFLQVHVSQDTFDPERRFRPWVFTIAANKGRDYLRRKGRRFAVELSAPVGGSSDGEGAGGATFVDLLAIDVPSPDASMDREDRERLVQRALGGMSPTLREVLLLAYFQRLSYAQIADDLGIPLGTVKSRLHAAVASFARNWERVSREGGTAAGEEREP